MHVNLHVNCTVCVYLLESVICYFIQQKHIDRSQISENVPPFLKMGLVFPTCNSFLFKVTFTDGKLVINQYRDFIRDLFESRFAYLLFPELFNVWTGSSRFQHNTEVVACSVSGGLSHVSVENYCVKHATSCHSALNNNKTLVWFCVDFACVASHLRQRRMIQKMCLKLD